MNHVSILMADEAKKRLESAHFGHLGCCLHNQPLVYPMAYAYHDGIIYGQTTLGEKVRMLRENNRVCFQVESVEGKHWWSVQCTGSYEELDAHALQGAEQLEIAQALSEKLHSVQLQHSINIRLHPQGYIESLPILGQETILFRIVIDECSGRECAQ